MTSFGSTNPCLIGGTGRSGTTILRRIFARHPSVVAVPEPRFSIDPDGLIDFYNGFVSGWSPYLFDIKLKRLARCLRTVGRSAPPYKVLNATLVRTGLSRFAPFKATPPYTGTDFASHCPEYFALVEELMHDLTDFRYSGNWTGAGAWQTDLSLGGPFSSRRLEEILGQFWRRVIASSLQHANANHFVEDNTWNILWFDKVLKLLPGARLVHIYRDPRDVVASFTQQRWAPSDPAQAAEFFKKLIGGWWTVRDLLTPNSFLEVNLEGLVADPRSVLVRICEFWEIPWHENLLTVKLDRAHEGRWRREFRPDQQEQVTQILAGALSRLGYD